jgi:hypothetical protein
MQFAASQALTKNMALATVYLQTEMANKIILFFTTVYFIAGNILLPQGDFAAIAQLPAMYQHCKTTEDPDINLPDFIIEHLLNIEDTDEDSDGHELPHHPIAFHHTGNNFVYFSSESVSISLEKPKPHIIYKKGYKNPFSPRPYISLIFQPPKSQSQYLSV